MTDLLDAPRVVSVDDLYLAFAEQVRRIVARRIRNRDDADDLVQEVFLRCHRSIDALDDGRDPGPWVRTIALNTTIEHLRRLQRTPDLDELGDDASGGAVPSVDRPALEQILDGDRRAALKATLDELPERQRRLLWLSSVEDHSLEQLATTEAMTTNAVKQAIKRGRAAARERYRALSLQQGLAGVAVPSTGLFARARLRVHRAAAMLSPNGPNGFAELVAGASVAVAAGALALFSLGGAAPVTEGAKAPDVAILARPASADLPAAPSGLASAAAAAASGATRTTSTAAGTSGARTGGSGGSTTSHGISTSGPIRAGVGTNVIDEPDKVEVNVVLEGHAPDGVVHLVPYVSTDCGTTVRHAACTVIRAAAR